ncbi:helix-turn-helix transcriptional regulator [Actinocorallia lasiicapitis]
MASDKLPTVRSRRIGRILREHREALGLSIQNLAERAARVPSNISNIENGLVRIRPRDLPLLFDCYGVAGVNERRSLTRLVEQMYEKSWTQPFGGQVSQFLMDLVSLEGDSSHIRCFEQLVFPGLLQRPAYARALLGLNKQKTARSIETYVTFRTRRVHILDRPDPAEVTVVLGEAALRCQVGGPAALREQIEFTLSLAEQEKIDLRVLPFTAGGHAALSGAFSVYTVSAPLRFSVVEAEYSQGGLFLEDETSVEKHLEMYAGLLELAMDRKSSVELMKGLVSEP